MMQPLTATPVSCLIAAVMCLFGSVAYADFAYDFSTPPPATFIDTPSTLTGTPSAAYSSSVSGGVLRFGDSTHPNDGGAVITIAYETGQVFTDVRATATLNPAGTSNNILNVSVRGTPAAGNTYAVGVDFQDGTLLIGKIMGDRPVDLVLSTDRGQGSQPPLTDLARSYFLQVDAIGNTVTARLFDSPGGAQLRLVNYTDTGSGGPAFTSGVSGLSALSLFETPLRLDGTFDNFTSTAVPEPGAGALWVFIGLTLCQRRPSRRGRPCLP
jgi:hypothetical protein